MKKLLIFAICLLVMAACKKEEKPVAIVEEQKIDQNDSLMKVIEQ